MNIAGLKLENNLILAPLAGVSDVGFRAVCSQCGAAMTYSEMLSAQAMAYNSQKTKEMAIVHPSEKIKIAQIFGHDPEIMAQAVQNPVLKDFNGFDINMGCPAPKVVKNGDGSALLKNLSLAGKIVSAVKKATNLPVSVKVRTGFDKVNIAEIIKMCEDNGADFVTVHGRTYNQGFSGEVDLEAIALAKNLAKIPVIGNGDVVDEKSFNNMISTKVDAVMIGRGAIGCPWVFSKILNQPIKDRFQIILNHVEILKKYYPEKWLTLYLRKHFLAYAGQIHVKGETKRKLATSTSIQESLEILKGEFNHFDIS